MNIVFLASWEKLNILRAFQDISGQLHIFSIFFQDGFQDSWKRHWFQDNFRTFLFSRTFQDFQDISGRVAALGLRGLTQEQGFSRHIDPYQVIGNHILQLLAKFHQNPMQRLEVMSKKVDFWPLIPYNPTNPFIGDEKKLFQKILQMILRLVSIHN